MILFFIYFEYNSLYFKNNSLKMNTIVFDENISLTQNHFINIADFYNYIVENQIITEVWYLNPDDLSIKSKELLEKSKNNSNFINI